MGHGLEPAHTGLRPWLRLRPSSKRQGFGSILSRTRGMEEREKERESSQTCMFHGGAREFSAFEIAMKGTYFGPPLFLPLLPPTAPHGDVYASSVLALQKQQYH